MGPLDIRVPMQNVRLFAVAKSDTEENNNNNNNNNNSNGDILPEIMTKKSGSDMTSSPSPSTSPSSNVMPNNLDDDDNNNNNNAGGLRRTPDYDISEENILLLPKEKRVVQLSIVPRKEGRLEIKGLEFELCGMVPVKIELNLGDVFYSSLDDDENESNNNNNI